MNCIYIGTFIKQRRKELKLTQEQVCSGICDPVTLSRIENGKQTPSKSVISALLQRLGMPEARYYVLESKNELEIEALKKDIIACGVTRNVSLGFEKLSQLENLTVSDDHLTRQFILRSKALLGSFDKRYTYDEQIDMLMSAIHLTVPDFNIEEINKCFPYKNNTQFAEQMEKIPNRGLFGIFSFSLISGCSGTPAPSSPCIF